MNRLCQEPDCFHRAVDRCTYCGKPLCYTHAIRVTDSYEGWITLCRQCREEEEREREHQYHKPLG